ncbi:MAG: TerC family protein [Aureliella sp.]|jgi:predicted tellurium resistance membrane protein TerC
MESIAENLIALIALSAMEIVLGIDNLVFISILTSKLPLERQSSARRWGLALALLMRIGLLSTIFLISRAVEPLFHLADYLPVHNVQQYFMTEEEPASGDEETADSGHGFSKSTTRKVLNAHAWREFNEVSLRDIILFAGGLFLLYKSVREIHSEVVGQHDQPSATVRHPSFANILFQIALMDIIFSLDSVITAVGMANTLWVMISAVILAVAVMILFANQVGSFVSNNPTIKMLALNFLLIVGIMLVAEGIGTPISKGYIYFAMAFSLLVEFLNLRVRKVSDRSEAKTLDGSSGI